MSALRHAARALLPAALLAGAAAGPVRAQSSVAPTTGGVRPGVEALADSLPAVLRGKRVGLVTNHTGRDRTGRSTIDVLAARTDLALVALYGPEHGIRGTAKEGEKVASGRDEATGLPVHSLYGAARKPTDEMLAGVEALVFDIQDVGARPYTYVYTMALAMEAAAERRIPFVVLDRPNPIGGTLVEGGLLDTAYASFVGMYAIPERHGMTVGELARLFNDRERIGAELVVVPAQGWRRDAWQDETGIQWVNPSPNIRRLDAAIHYPGTVLFEGTNLSEGRGTDMPFEQVGAPWLRADSVAAAMNALRLPGVRFEAVRMAIAAGANKFPGQTVPGVRLVITEREAYAPVRTSVRLIETIRRLHPRDFQFTGQSGERRDIYWIDRLSGSAALRHALERGTVDELLVQWFADEQRFREIREQYLLY